MIFVVWVAVALASAAALWQAQRQSREELETRFKARVDTTTRFVETYVTELAQQERRLARQELAGETVSRRSFERLLALFGSPAAVLLNGTGEVLHVAPRAPSVIGQDLAARYAHLRAATQGRLGISNAVPSAVRREPVIAFAVPFSSAAGRRVFSAAFPIAETPLAIYLRKAGVLPPNRAYLVDSRGMVVAGNASVGPGLRSLAAVSPALARSVGTRSHGTGHTAAKEYFAAEPVQGTPWRLIVSAPEHSLYQTISGSKRWIPWLLWLGFVTGGLACVVLVGRLIASRAELRKMNARLDRLARLDTLTGLANRRGIEETSLSVLAGASRHGYDAAVLLIDVDHFKQINDTYGHGAGDDVLNAIARCLRANLRDADVIGRWGGEEFLVVLPFTDGSGAELVAERLRRVVAGTPMTAGKHPVMVTISIGCAGWRRGETLSALMHRTDAALYQAKARGRDRVISADAPWHAPDEHELQTSQPSSVDAPRSHVSSS